MLGSSGQQVIVINGTRYNVAIRLDATWRYIAEWWNDKEYHKFTLDDNVRSDSEAEREAFDEIHRAGLRQEPWLCVKVAEPEREGFCPQAEPLTESLP